MEIIHSIKISYFRSIYTASLARCKSLNIISGRNDSGKSNVLKSLNLFFNGATDWNVPFDFHTEFSVHRRQQVRRDTVKGKQFISITVSFTRPPNYQNSLPEVFTVKRTWLRNSTQYQETNNLESLANQNRLPTNLQTARRFSSQFLNRIHFEYVPAVKDRTYFLQLHSSLQARLFSGHIDPTAAPVVGDLTSHIQGQIGQLQSDFQRATGINTFIRPPEELAALFQSFSVSTIAQEGNIPLMLRGDGIQARYVPSVLNYISSRSPDFFIWGFEEPENSLEYSFTSSLAKDFEDTYSKNAQIFTTTHSPAFVSLVGQNTALYRAYQVDSRTNLAPIIPGGSITAHGEALKEELGILEIQREVNHQLTERLQQHEALVSREKRLNEELARLQMPLLLVEGNHDQETLEAVWSKLYSSAAMPFTIRVADPVANISEESAAGAQSLARMIESFHPDEGRKALALFDGDYEGFKSFDKLSNNFNILPSNNRIKIHRNGLSSAMILTCPPFRTDYDNARNLPMEFLFPDNVLSRRTNDSRGLVLSNPQLTVVSRSRPVDVGPGVISQLQMNLQGYTTIESGKDVFAQEIVPTCTPAECEAFIALFEKIMEHLNVQLIQPT